MRDIVVATPRGQAAPALQPQGAPTASSRRHFCSDAWPPPLRATLIGSDRCEAEGCTITAYAPLLAMCRKLVAAGYDPATPLEAYRGDMLCLRVRLIGEGAKQTVKDSSTGTPTFRRYQEPVLGIARASSIAPDLSEALP